MNPYKKILIAPFFIVLSVFFLPLNTNFFWVIPAFAIAALLLTPYYRPFLWKSFNTPWSLTALIFFLYVLIASSWSLAPWYLRWELIEKYSKIMILPFFAAGFIHPKTRKYAFNAYFLAMLLTCFVSGLKHYGFVPINPDDPGQVFYNHIMTSFMVALGVYFAIILFFQEDKNNKCQRIVTNHPTGHSERSEGSPKYSTMPQQRRSLTMLGMTCEQWQRIYYLLMIFMGSYQIFFLNMGRTGYVIYIILISLVMIQKLPIKKALIGMVILLACIATVYTLSPVMQFRVAALISDMNQMKQDNKNTSLGFRVQFHEYAQKLFEEHPITGIGTGGFKYRFNKDKPVPKWDEQILHDPHNQYWLILADLGSIGFLLYFLFLASLFLTALKLSKETKPILLGMLLSFCLGSITDSIFCYSAVGGVFVLICSLCFGELIEK